MTYHLGLCFGPEYGKPADTLVLEARHSIDFLACEMWLYLGYRETTKTRLRQNRRDILAMINREQGTAYSRLIVD